MLSVSKLTKPTYYMRNLEFNFKFKQDDVFSSVYKEHFHRSWIDLRFNEKQVKLRKQDIVFRKIELPVQTEKPTLILNLDQTLIFCCKNLTGDAAIEFQYKQKQIKANIKIRPHLTEFLKEASTLYELVLFSASHRYYVKAVLKAIDPDGIFFSYVIPSKHCVKVDGQVLKPLRILNRDPRKVLIVDHSSFAFCKDVDNGVPIVPFSDNPDDIELLLLLGYLKKAAESSDVRKFNRRHFKLHKYGKSEDLKNLYDVLFGK